MDTVDVLTKVDDQVDITCFFGRVSFFEPSPGAEAGPKGEENSAIAFVWLEAFRIRSLGGRMSFGVGMSGTKKTVGVLFAFFDA